MYHRGVQSADTEPQGRRFIEAWKKARIIIDRVAEMPPKPAATPKPVPAASGTAA